MKNGTSCKPCPTGASCVQGTTLATLSVDNGFWRASRASSEVIKCPYEAACAADKENAIYFNASGSCAEGYQGPVCGTTIRTRTLEHEREHVRTSPTTLTHASIASTTIAFIASTQTLLSRSGVCEAGYVRSGRIQPCEECRSEALAWVSAVLSLLLVVCFGLLMMLVNRKVSGGKLRPVINLMQSVSVMLLFNAPFPDFLVKLAQWMSAIDLNVQFANPACIGLDSFFKTFVAQIGFLVVAGGTVWLPVLRQKWHRCRSPKDHEDQDSKDNDPGADLEVRADASTQAFNSALRDTFILVLLVHPSLTGRCDVTIAHTLTSACDEIETVPILLLCSQCFHINPSCTALLCRSMEFFRCQAIEGKSYLMADYTEECYTQAWYAKLALVLPVLLFFSAGSIAAIVLVRHRARVCPTLYLYIYIYIYIIY